MKNTTIIIAALLSCVAVLAQDLKPQIAVYVTGSIKENERKALNTEILHALVKSGRYTAVERSKEFLAALDQEQKKQRSGAVDDNQIRVLGKRFGVKFICIADITNVFNDYQISTRIVDVETAAVDAMGKAYSKLKSREDLEEASNQLIESMFSGRAETDDKIQPTELTSPQAYNDRAIEFGENGEFDKAIADLTEAIRLDPNEGMYYFNRGIVHSRQNNYYNAIDDYNKALSIKPDLFAAYVSRGSAYYRQEDYQSALKDYTKGIELNPSNADELAVVFDFRGNTYRKLEEYDKAINDYETALRIDPNLTRARDNLEAVKQEKLAAQPPPPTMQQFWGSLYGPGSYNDDFNAPYFEQDHGNLAQSSSKASSDDDYESKVRFGSRTVMSFQNVNFKDEYEGESYEEDHFGFGMQQGLILNIPISKRIAIEPGVYFHIREFTNDDDSYGKSITYEEGVLSFPLVLQFATRPPPGFALYAEGGVILDLPLWTEFTELGYILDEPEPMEDRASLDFGFILGGGISFNIGPVVIRLGYRYINNFTDFLDEGYGTLTQHQISLGFML